MKRRILTAAVIAAAMFTACSDDATTNEVVDANATIGVAATVSSSEASSKLAGATGDEWTKGDLITCIAVDQGAESSVYSSTGDAFPEAPYHQFEAYEDGANVGFLTVDFGWHYPTGGTSFDLVSVFGTDNTYAELQDLGQGSDWSVKANVAKVNTDGEQASDADLMYAYGNSTVDGNTIQYSSKLEDVALAFDHLLSRVIVTYSSTSGEVDLNDLNVSSIQVSDLITSATVNDVQALHTAAVTGGSFPTDYVTHFTYTTDKDTVYFRDVYNDAYTAADAGFTTSNVPAGYNPSTMRIYSDGIVLPQAVSNMKFQIDTPTKRFFYNYVAGSGDLDNLEPGKVYLLNLNFVDETIDVTVSVNDWIVGGYQEGAAE